MNTRLLLTTTAFALTASVATAQSVPEQLISQLEAQGYTLEEIEQGLSQIDAEEILEDTDLENVYATVLAALQSYEIGTLEPNGVGIGFVVRHDRRDDRRDDRQDDRQDDRRDDSPEDRRYDRQEDRKDDRRDDRRDD